MKTIESFHHKLAFIIPTRNRSSLITKMLDSILLQAVQPRQIVIVDGSDTPHSFDVTGYSELNLTYVHISSPGLTKQRNMGINLLQPDITLAGYLDDDIELEPCAIEAMLQFWETCPLDTGGGIQYCQHAG